MVQPNAEWKRDNLAGITDALLASYRELEGINHIDGLNIPSSESVLSIVADFFRIIFPGFQSDDNVGSHAVLYHVGNILDRLHDNLAIQIERSLRYGCRQGRCDGGCDCASEAAARARRALESLPSLRRSLRKDVQAAYDGDPAAPSTDEVIVSYPFVKAITAHRIAHALYDEKVPLIPRLISEWAHRETGIDIHPGAQIGESFFIDHGTGVVIGETTVIGANVKLYQGVTLGALSFPKDADGRVVKGGKRHPTLLDNVTVYANATILGGDTVVGRNSVVGGNVWLTKSVPDDTIVTMASPELIYKKKR